MLLWQKKRRENSNPRALSQKRITPQPPPHWLCAMEAARPFPAVTRAAVLSRLAEVKQRLPPAGASPADFVHAMIDLARTARAHEMRRASSQLVSIVFAPKMRKC